MAIKPFSESYKGCTINAHNHGYMITGSLNNTVDNQQLVATNVNTGEKIPLPGPSSDSKTWMQAAKTWMQAAKTWIDAQWSANG